MNLRWASYLLVGILCFWGLQIPVEMNSSTIAVALSTPSSEYYILHEPISIESDQDFIDGGFAGNGSKGNPFILEQLNVTSSILRGNAISIRDTSAYFIIRDCHIMSRYIGILVADIAVGTGSIINNTCISSSGGGGGIVIGTDNLTVLENRCENWAQGIHLNEVSQCLTSGNNISDSTYQGINIRYSNNNIITSNRITNSTQHGLVFVGTSSNNVAYDNTFIDNGNVDEYVIDNERTGTLTSQGYDEGDNNHWYDMNTNTGNWWSDYSGLGSYAIDGPADNTDPYPNHSQSSQNNGDVMLAIILIGSLSAIVVVLLVVGFRVVHK